MFCTYLDGALAAIDGGMLKLVKREVGAAVVVDGGHEGFFPVEAFFDFDVPSVVTEKAFCSIPIVF